MDIWEKGYALGVDKPPTSLILKKELQLDLLYHLCPVEVNDKIEQIMKVFYDEEPKDFSLRGPPCKREGKTYQIYMPDKDNPSHTLARHPVILTEQQHHKNKVVSTPNSEL